MKTRSIFRNFALHLCLALALGLAGCGGGGGGNPADPVVPPVVPPVVAPPVVVPPVVNPNPPDVGPSATPTIAFTTPAEDQYFTGPMEFAFAVTNSPDKVELYKNGVLEATLLAPFAYRWENPSEVEGTYTFTAKTIKSGATDVTSAPRTIIIDRTFPTLVSRTPANGAVNVLSGEEISITLSEPMMASSIDGNTVKLLKNGIDVDNIATLDSTGKKISVRFKNSQLYPATLTLVVNGIKDLSGKRATIADATFGAVSVVLTGGTPTVVLSFLTDTGTDTNRITKASRGRTLGSHMAYAQVAWASLPANVRYAELLVGEKVFTYLGDQISASQNPDICTLGGYCTSFTFGFGSKSNGTLPMKARLTLVDGSVIESAVKPLVVARVNAAADGTAFPSGWTLYTQGAFEGYGGVDNVGTIDAIDTPSVYRAYAANPNYYSPGYGVFFQHVGAETTGGIIEYSRNFPVTGLGIDDEHRPGFGAQYFNPNPTSADKVRVRVRSCDANRQCSVWNTSTGTASAPDYTGGLGSSPPWIPGVTYIQVVLRFQTEFKSRSDAAIGDLFFGY